MKKAIASVIFAVLAVLTIGTMAAGAATPEVTNWYHSSGKSEVAKLKSDFKEIQHDVRVNKPLDLMLDCGGLKFDSNLNLNSSDIPDPIMQAEWRVINVDFHNAGTDCVKSLETQNAQAGKAMVKNFKEGTNLLKKLVNQVNL